MEKSKKVMASLFAITTLMLAPALSFAGETEDRLSRMEREINKLKTELDGKHGLSGETTLGGYGELHFNDYKNNNKDSMIDFHRFVLFLGHEFNDRVSFHSELEVEHSLAGKGKPGEVELEQAYIDIKVIEPLNFRAGLMIMPIGFMNETHEPDTFYGVERPDVENLNSITWWEAGFGIFGEVAEGLSYKLYMVSTPNAANFEGNGSEGIKGGRQKVAKAVAEDFGVVGRLEYSAIPGLKLGASYFSGDTSQGNDAMGSATVTITEADFQFSQGPVDLKGMYTQTELDDADKVNLQLDGPDLDDLPGDGQMGDKMTGAYVEAAIRLFSLMDLDTDHELTVFVRQSEYNTHDSVTGFTANKAYDVEILTVGLDYKPVENVVFKVDYQNRDNASKDPADKATDQINIGMGYSF